MYGCVSKGGDPPLRSVGVSTPRKVNRLIEKSIAELEELRGVIEWCKLEMEKA